MWKCPACETLNDKEVCVICGEHKPATGAEYTPPVAPIYTPSAEPEVTSSAARTEYSPYVPPRSEPLDAAPKISYSVPPYSPGMARDSLDPARPLDPTARLEYSEKPEKKSSAGIIVAVIMLAIIAILIIAGVTSCEMNEDDSSYSTSSSTVDLEPYYNGSKWGYVDSDGDIVVDCTYTEANEFVNGMARVRNYYGEYGFIDENGYQVIPCMYEDASDFYSDGTARVYNGKEYFWINTSGAKVD